MLQYITQEQKKCLVQQTLEPAKPEQAPVGSVLWGGSVASSVLELCSAVTRVTSKTAVGWLQQNECQSGLLAFLVLLCQVDIPFMANIPKKLEYNCGHLDMSLFLQINFFCSKSSLIELAPE